VSAVLTDAWFAQINARLARAATRAPRTPEGKVQVVFEFAGAPPNEPSAMTVTIDNSGATITPGGDDAADVIVRLSFEDAVALAEGTVAGGRALREGRLKVRGDTDALNLFGAWIVAAQAAGIEESP
jgi:hypothetical protein